MTGRHPQLLRVKIPRTDTLRITDIDNKASISSKVDIDKVQQLQFCAVNKCITHLSRSDLGTKDSW